MVVTQTSQFHTATLMSLGQADHFQEFRPAPQSLRWRTPSCWTVTAVPNNSYKNFCGALSGVPQNLTFSIPICFIWVDFIKYWTQLPRNNFMFCSNCFCDIFSSIAIFKLIIGSTFGHKESCYSSWCGSRFLTPHLCLELPDIYGTIHWQIFIRWYRLKLAFGSITEFICGRICVLVDTEPLTLGWLWNTIGWYVLFVRLLDQGSH